MGDFANRSPGGSIVRRPESNVHQTPTNSRLVQCPLECLLSTSRSRINRRWLICPDVLGVVSAIFLFVVLAGSAETSYPLPTEKAIGGRGVRFSQWTFCLQSVFSKDGSYASCSVFALSGWVRGFSTSTTSATRFL